jgi:hypothetical protein
MSDELTDKITKEHFPAEVPDAAGQCIARGRARLVPESNLGTFLPDNLGAHVDAQLLGPNPVALQRQNGPVYKVNTFKLGEGTHVSRYFTFRHYGTVGSSGQS